MRSLIAGLAMLMTAAAATLAGSTTGARATDIEYIVNSVPITSYDIARRVAFLKLQRHRGNLHEEATQDMIDQTLRLQEIARLKVKVSDEEVAAAYARFASSNKISTQKLDAALGQAGVTKKHFLEFIRSQIGWGRVLQARFQATERMSEQDAVQKMLKQGGQKPTAKEYILQQVIFVVPPQDKSAIMGKRKREAEAMRNRFRNCGSTRDFAKGLVDVTVRDLGRVLQPALPTDWKGDVTKLSPGQATPIHVTDRGVEFIGVCSAREVSDDRVAQMVFQSEKSDGSEATDLTKKYMAELHKRARIVKR